MAPQRLSEIDNTAEVYHTPGPFDKVPDLAVLTARCISAASEYDARLGSFLVDILGTKAAPVAAILEKERTRIEEIVKRAAATVLHPEDFAMLKGILTAADGFRPHRNRFAHCQWAYSPTVNDAILFVEQVASIKLMLLLNAEQAGETNSNVDFQKEYVWVYRKDDLEQILREIREARKNIMILGVVISDRDFVPQYVAELAAIPHVAKALESLRADQRRPSASQSRRHPTDQST